MVTISDSMTEFRSSILSNFNNLTVDIHSTRLSNGSLCRFLNVTITNEASVLAHVPNFRIVCIGEQQNICLKLLCYQGLTLSQETISFCDASKSQLLLNFSQNKTYVCEGFAPNTMDLLPTHLVIQKLFIEPFGPLRLVTARSQKCSFMVYKVEYGRIICDECRKCQDTLNQINSDVKMEREDESNSNPFEPIPEDIDDAREHNLKFEDESDFNHLIEETCETKSSVKTTKLTNSNKATGKVRKRIKNTIVEPERKSRKRRRKDEPIYGTCPLCLKEFTAESAFDLHMLYHNEELATPAYDGQVLCHICHQALSSRYELNPHIEMVHGEEARLMCYICLLPLNRRSLKIHMHKSHDAPSHLCPICGKGFVQNYDLKQHTLMSHAPKEERQRFICDTCGRAFSVKRNMMWHVANVHSKKKTFICGICSKGFAVKCQFKSHLLIHTGLKPYSCYMCDFRAVRKENVTQHIRKQHKVEGKPSDVIIDFKLLPKNLTIK